MATYVLIHGASDAFYWHRVIPLLRERGHEVVAPDLPVGDEQANFADYTDTVVRAVGHLTNVIVVGQSMGAYTAPLVCQRVPVELLVLIAPMIPAPGETPGDWWDNTGQPAAQRALDEREGRDPQATFDALMTFFHDVPQEVIANVLAHGVPAPADGIFGQPWPLDAWPDVPTKVLVGRNDRLFPLEFARRIAKERLGVDVDDTPGGHLLALGHPEAVVDWLESCRVDHERAG
ncbi:alpha/beta hydrolase [Actinophytocola xinjiangensis]|uniref:Alpha/beta hydrolase n=1 Tax=Actinophytocola xinjiangensis TaxID=485602 RepID=A0A7Z0WLD8_9PSEU|nr:alpha/beta hydrolase [Actinophytocola xinjiangensis]OLF08979.1 alpha/beta hydrolase [Actinophytocola xinjiangensis]